ncbi:hypothetical protein PWT90_08205 [Aphanocladium album]|nr:hypothetical protein PWT90_08205 [Aphanocladium album]
MPCSLQFLVAFFLAAFTVFALATSASDATSYYSISPSDQLDQCVVAQDWKSVPPEQYPIRIQPCSSAGDGAAWNIMTGLQGRVKISNKLYPTRDLDYVQPDGYPNVAILGPPNTIYHNQDYVIKDISSGRHHIVNAWLDNTGLCTKQAGDVLAVTLDSCGMSWVITPVSSSSVQVVHGGSTSSQPAPDLPSPSSAPWVSPTPEVAATSPATTASLTTPPTATATDLAVAPPPPESQSTSLRVDARSSTTTFRTSIISTKMVEVSKLLTIPQPTSQFTTPTQSTNASHSKTENSKAKVGKIVGESIGGLAAIVLLAVAGICIHRWSQRQKQRNPARQHHGYEQVPEMDKTNLCLA